MTPEQKSAIDELIDLAKQARDFRIAELLAIHGFSSTSEPQDALDDPLLIRLDDLCRRLVSLRDS